MQRRSVATGAAIALLAAAGCSGGGDGAPPEFPVAEHEWSWIPVDGSRCMDGSATGIGVNLDFSSDRLLIDSDEHVWTSRPLGGTSAGGVSLGAWIEDLSSGAPGWASVIP